LDRVISAHLIGRSTTFFCETYDLNSVVDYVRALSRPIGSKTKPKRLVLERLGRSPSMARYRFTLLRHRDGNSYRAGPQTETRQHVRDSANFYIGQNQRFSERRSSSTSTRDIRADGTSPKVACCFTPLRLREMDAEL